MQGAIEGERKQVSVLFCDIVRSSALAAELGPEEFHLVIDRFFRVALAEVHRYEGTVNQFLGDGFMALFGAPIAHEDHARHAVLWWWWGRSATTCGSITPRSATPRCWPPGCRPRQCRAQCS